MRERACNIKAKGCQKKFTPRTLWQKTCDNEECQKERKRRNARKWYVPNKEHRREYLHAYHLL